MSAGTIEASPLSVDFAARLRDVITDCDELTVAMKAVQARTPSSEPVWCVFDRLRLKVACLRSSAYGATTTATALAVTGQPVMPAAMPPAPEGEPEELHVQYRAARRRALSGKELAAGAGLEREEASR